MVDLSECAKLPEAVEQDFIEKELESLLARYWNSRELAVIECIYELAIRQANNYSLIREELRTKLSEYLMRVWKKDSVESTESCLAVIINFGLQSAYEMIVSEAPYLSNIEVRKEIEDTIKDVGLDIQSVGFSGPQ